MSPPSKPWPATPVIIHEVRLEGSTREKPSVTLPSSEIAGLPGNAVTPSTLAQSATRSK